MFKDHQGPITQKLRDRAVELTGLKWSKIYKWMFDKGDRLPSIHKRKVIAKSKSEKSFEKVRSSVFRTLKIFEVTKVKKL